MNELKFSIIDLLESKVFEDSSILLRFGEIASFLEEYRTIFLFSIDRSFVWTSLIASAKAYWFAVLALIYVEKWSSIIDGI